MVDPFDVRVRHGIVAGKFSNARRGPMRGASSICGGCGDAVLLAGGIGAEACAAAGSFGGEKKKA